MSERVNHDTRYCESSDWHKCAACVAESQALHTQIASDEAAHDAEGRFWR